MLNEPLAITDQPLVTGRRVAARARVALRATIETLNGTARAILRNISETGAMLELTQLPSVGADAVVRCGSLECFGQVVWARSRWCGIAFDEPITHTEVLAVREEYERSAGRDLKELEEAARQWAAGASIR